MADRIVLVRMALGTTDRQAEPGGAGGVGAIDGSFDAELLRVGAAFLVERCVAMEAGRDDLILRGIRQQVARQLLDSELIERHVLVEGVDEPIAPGPDRALAVDGVAVGIGVAGEVEPVAGLTFAIVWRGEQAIDQFFVSVRVSIFDKFIDFLRRRQQARSNRATTGGSAWRDRPPATAASLPSPAAPG